MGLSNSNKTKDMPLKNHFFIVGGQAVEFLSNRISDLAALNLKRKNATLSGFTKKLEDRLELSNSSVIKLTSLFLPSLLTRLTGRVRKSMLEASVQKAISFDRSCPSYSKSGPR